MQYVQFAMGVFGPEIGITMMKPQKIMRFMAENLNIPEEMKFTEADEAKAMEMIQNLSMQQQVQNVPQQQAV